jgi:hypothetical protein
MATPSVRDVHVNAVLSNISIAYKNNMYIAEQVFPRVPVQKKSDFYYTFDKGAFFRDEVGVRAPGTRARRADYSVCIEYALAKEVSDELYLNSDAPFRPAIEATEYVTDALLRAQERRVALLTTGASAGWTTTASPSVQWTSDSSDPWNDIDDVIAGVVNTCGVMPNTMVMSYNVWRELRRHPDFVDRVKYVSAKGRVDVSDVANWFNLPNVLVGTALYDSTKELASTACDLTPIWGDAVWIGYVPSSPGLMTPAAGYVFEWMARQTRTYRMDQERTDVFEASHSTDEVVSSSDAGGIIINAI